MSRHRMNVGRVLRVSRLKRKLWSASYDSYKTLNGAAKKRKSNKIITIC